MDSRVPSLNLSTLEEEESVINYQLFGHLLPLSVNLKTLAFQPFYPPISFKILGRILGEKPTFFSPLQCALDEFVEQMLLE